MANGMDAQLIITSGAGQQYYCILQQDQLRHGFELLGILPNL